MLVIFPVTARPCVFHFSSTFQWKLDYRLTFNIVEAYHVAETRRLQLHDVKDMQ